MLTPTQAEFARKMGMSEKGLEQFIRWHEEMALTGIHYGKGLDAFGKEIETSPNWPLYYRLVDHVLGKPAVAEPKPDAVDPFKEIDREKMPTDDELNAMLAPRKKLRPPPELTEE